MIKRLNPLKPLQPGLVIAVFSLFLAFLIASPSASAEANFNYSNLSLQLGKSVLKQKIDIANLEQHRDLQVRSVGFGFHFKNGILFNASHTQGISEKTLSKISSDTSAIKLGYVIGIRNNLDLYSRIGGYQGRAKACLISTCAQAKDYGYSWDFGSVWARKYIEYGVNFSINKYGEEPQDYYAGAQAALLIDRYSSLTSTLGFNDDSLAITLGYRFNFNHKKLK